MRLSQLVALGGVALLCACASSPKVKDSWAVKQAAENPTDRVQLLHKDHSVATTMDHKQLQLIADVARQIALSSGRGSRVYLVETSDPVMVNAFAWADENEIGYIFITLPMAQTLGEDPDQWAALLGHETGHLAKDHQKANASRQATLQGTATALGFIPLPLIGALARAVAMPIATTAINAHYSRDQEREADALSVVYMTRAGYDPNGAIHLQQTLLAISKHSGGGFFASHPGGEERIHNLQVEIAKLPQERLTGKASSSDSKVDAAQAPTPPRQETNDAGARSQAGKPADQ